MSFQQIIRRKRVKVLLLVLMLIFLTFTKGNASPNLLSVIKNAEIPYEAVCISDENVENSGLTWIFPIPETQEDLPNIETKYVPNIENEYSCDFSVANKCLKQWKMSGWNFSENNESFHSVLDSRADAFSTIYTSNTTKEFHERIEIPQEFNLGISLRSSHYGEIFFCEGWNPYSYPCYYLNIGGDDGKTITLKKIKGLSKEILNSNENLGNFEGEIVISAYEWKSYKIAFNKNGTFEIIDLVLEKSLLRYSDPNKLKPIYLLLRSRSPALWKIHKIRYIYTTTPGMTKLGPTLNLNSKNLCISMFLSMCKNCSFTFSLVTEAKQEVVLLTVKNDDQNEKGEKWKQVELKKNDLVSSSVKLHVKTEITGNAEKPFWAVSNVRVCNSKEIRSSIFVYNTTKNKLRPEYDLACQFLRHPTWRPTMYKAVPFDIRIKKISADSNEIVVQWEYSTSQKQLPYQPYVSVEYQAKNICNDTEIPDDTVNRNRSSGFLVTRDDDVQIKNLVPYTTYNICLTDIISNKQIIKEVKTAPSVLPTRGEIPENVIIQPTDTLIKINWKRPSCLESYGPIVYKIHIKNDSEVLRSLEVNKDDSPNFAINNLEPFTPYIFEIFTARSLQDLNNIDTVHINTYKFSTSPGVSPAVIDLEVYEIDTTYACIRYKMPAKPFGIPQYVKVKYCNPIVRDNCTTLIKNITKCVLWEEFYCLEIINLLSNLQYTFSVAIKNANTDSFGTSSDVIGLTTPHVPGKPSNVTYELNCYHDTQYCNIRINWCHPYNPKGLITAFRVSLHNKNFNVEDFIEEIYKIPNRSYHKQYSHIVKYIPYGSEHTLKVEGINNYYNEGDFEAISVSPRHVHYVDFTPSVDATEFSLIATLPPKDQTVKTKTFVVVQDYDRTVVNTAKEISTSPCSAEKCNSYGAVWLANDYKENVDDDNSTTISIESFVPFEKSNTSGANDVVKLKPNTTYCVVIVTQHNFYNKSECEIFSFKNVTTSSAPENSTSEELPIQEQPFASVSLILGILFIFISLSVCGIIWYRRYRRKRFINCRNRNRVYDENIYEQMPFDDLEESVNNPLYDRLEY
ncbi:uncharacterized protein LOC108741364, partial [Agrilus planipennis]|uniref:Uncharacterized protein LOC108741364 n=1 Tax=Agrilus planipennis TaxID=224129 RepID=A0A7F5R6U6_AGRPL